MDEKKPTIEESKNSVKETLYAQLSGAAKDLIAKVINAKTLGVMILAWFILSLGVSGYRRFGGTPEEALCKRQTALDSYLMGHLFCLK